MTADFPRPAPGTADAPFWEWCARGELRVQRCTNCGALRHHPRPRCPACRDDGYEWAPVSGRGTVYSYTICHPPVLPAYADAAPYNAVVVQLDEGPFMVSNLVDCPNDEVAVGLRVEVVFVPVDDTLVLPRFRRVDV